MIFKKSIMRIVITVFILWFVQAGLLAQNNDFDKHLKNAFEQLEPTGLCVAVVKDGAIVYKKAIGYKNAESHTALDTRSLFNIASCSKAFTAAAIGILVEQGKLKWTDKVVQYIPELRLSDPYITRELDITDILSHRSGLATFDGDLLWYGTDYTDEQIIDHMQYLPISQGFRRDFGYQNLMFMLAGKVVERVSGQTWSDFVRTHFFEPLDMSATRPSNDELLPTDNVTDGHIKGKPLGRYDFNGVKPAAALYSNVEDLANWTIMLLNDGNFKGTTILKPGTVNTLFAPKTLIPVGGSRKKMGIHFYAYGMGWFLSDYQGVKVVEHDGGMPGYISRVCLVPELGLSFISLNNGEEPFINDALKWTVIDEYLRQSGQKVPETDWIGQAVKRKKDFREMDEKDDQARRAARVQGTLPGVKPSALTGTYTDPTYGDAIVSLEDGQLAFSMLPSAKIMTGEMDHWHYDTYKVQFKDAFLPFALVTFQFNEKHEVTGLTIDCPIPDFHFDALKFIKKEP
jgi:CubicO group peptidase (beta-lactamase class C family)